MWLITPFCIDGCVTRQSDVNRFHLFFPPSDHVRFISQAQACGVPRSQSAFLFWWGNYPTTVPFYGNSVVHPLNNWVPAFCYWENARKFFREGVGKVDPGKKTVDKYYCSLLTSSWITVSRALQAHFVTASLVLSMFSNVVADLKMRSFFYHF